MTREEILPQIVANVGEAVARYKDSALNLGVLRELANDLETPGVDVFLASMPGTPSRVLDLLMQHNNPEVIRLLVQNPNLHAKLAAHPDATVRKLVAESRRLIREAITRGLVKPHDPETSNKHMKYVPAWA